MANSTLDLNCAQARAFEIYKVMLSNSAMCDNLTDAAFKSLAQYAMRATRIFESSVTASVEGVHPASEPRRDADADMDEEVFTCVWCGQTESVATVGANLEICEWCYKNSRPDARPKPKQPASEPQQDRCTCDDCLAKIPLKDRVEQPITEPQQQDKTCGQCIYFGPEKPGQEVNRPRYRVHYCLKGHAPWVVAYDTIVAHDCPSFEHQQHTSEPDTSWRDYSRELTPFAQQGAEPKTRKWGICLPNGKRVVGICEDTSEAAWYLAGGPQMAQAGYYSVRVDAEQENASCPLCGNDFSKGACLHYAEQEKTFRVGHGNVQTQQRAAEMQAWADRSMQSKKRFSEQENADAQRGEDGR